MRILIFVEEFTPDKGYMEYYLATELVKLGNNVRLLTSNGKGVLNDSILPEGFEVTVIPQLIQYYGYNIPTPAGLVEAVRILEQFRPNLVLCNPAFSPLSLVILYHPILSRSVKIGGLVTGGPTVVTSGLYSVNSFSSLLRYLMAKFVSEKIAARKLDKFLVLSHQLKRYLLRYFNINSSKFLVMPLGADSNLFEYDQTSRNKIRQSWGFSNEDVIVVYTGQIHHTKEIPLLVDAFAQVSNGESQAKLLIVGDGDKSLLDFIKTRCVQLEIEQNVLILPPVHRTELPGIFSACDIAVWPGGPSISIAEAASVGLPLLLQASPMTYYFVANDNGFVFNRGDETDLADKLKILITNPNIRKSMGTKSRELITQKLNWTSIASQLLDNIQTISRST